MARLPRLSVANHQHHILQCGNDKRSIFLDADDFAMFRRLLSDASKKFEVAIHAYVLMPDHFHLLVTPKSDEGIGKMMQWIGRHYVPYFMLCSRYIESNPVRNKLVVHPADYAESSYLHHSGALLDPLITDHALYWNLGNTPFQRESTYRELMEQALTPGEISSFTKASLQGWPLGTEQFKQQLEKHANRRIVPLKRGRPRLSSVQKAAASESI